MNIITRQEIAMKMLKMQYVHITQIIVLIWYHSSRDDNISNHCIQKLKC